MVAKEPQQTSSVMEEAPPSRRRVKFPDDGDSAGEGGATTTSAASAEIARIVCHLPSIDDFTEEDLELLWFSKADYHMSRSAAKVVSRESARYGFSKNLDETYSEKNADAQERLQLWAVHGDARRGLERWANKEHGDKRQHDQFEAIMAVLEAQDEMISKSRDGKVDVEKLRKVSHKATKTARHFARMIGKADSYAMASELDKVNIMNGSSNNGDAETVATASSTRSGRTSLHTSASSRKCGSATEATVDDDEDGDSMPSVIDGLKDSHHLGKAVSRFRRFGFKGKGHKDSSSVKSKEEERVPRVA